jgi:DNA replication and repair protein RecF
LNGFRSYDHAELRPSEGMNLLYGANAAGKTNVLEAVFLCALGRSHRTSRDQEMIGHGRAGAYVGLELETKNGVRNVEIKLRTGDDVNKNPKDKKQIFIDRQRAEKAGDLMGVLNVVMFSPEDLALVKASPDVRRRFMDMELCQLRPAFFYKLQQYNAALKQRSALLRAAIETGVQPDESHLDMWDDQLTELGGDIMLIRREFMDELSTLARDINRRITGGREELYAFYKPNVSFSDGGRDEVRAALSNALYNSREEDIRRGFTTRGPHRDDVGILIGDCDVRVFGSQGQQRTAALSMKLSEIALMRSEKGESPVLLLDDVLSELDGDRQRELLSSAFDCQCILTTTSPDGLEGVPDMTVFECANGKLAMI